MMETVRKRGFFEAESLLRVALDVAGDCRQPLRLATLRHEINACYNIIVLHIFPAHPTSGHQYTAGRSFSAQFDVPLSAGRRRRW